jgi:bifunctional DNA-binding transcriptional regulator/antitoxin component of YhaV-PrlF toxin-antitoxin module
MKHRSSIATLTRRRQFTLPAWLVRRYGLERGDQVVFTVKDGEPHKAFLTFLRRSPRPQGRKGASDA